MKNREKLAKKLQKIYIEKGKINLKELNCKDHSFYKEVLNEFGTMWRAFKFAKIPQKIPSRGITKEDCIEELKKLQTRFGKVTNALVTKEANVSVTKIYSLFGSMTQAKAEAGIKNEKVIKKTETKNKIPRITEQDVLAEIQRLYEKYGKVTKSIVNKNGKISYKTIFRLSGGLAEAKVKAGITKTIEEGQKKVFTKEELDAEVHRLVKKFGYISKPMMEKHSNINTKVVNRIYGNYRNMYNTLNIPYSKSGRVPTEQELIDEFLRLTQKYGDVTQEIIEQEAEFSTTCYKDRFGSINNLRKKLGLKPLPGGCKGASKTALWCIGKYEEFLNQKAELEKTFPWLKNDQTGKHLRIDAYFENLKIGIEYNGPQHYMNCSYYKDEQGLLYRQHLDKLKKTLCKQHGIRIISVKYTDKITERYIKKSLS